MDWDLIQGAKKFLAGQFVLNNLSMAPKQLGTWGLTWLASLPKSFQEPAKLSLQRKLTEFWPSMSQGARAEFFQGFPELVPSWVKKNPPTQFPSKPEEETPPQGPISLKSPIFPPQIPPNPREETY